MGVVFKEELIPLFSRVWGRCAADADLLVTIDCIVIGKGALNWLIAKLCHFLFLTLNNTTTSPLPISNLFLTKQIPVTFLNSGSLY